MRYAIRTAMLIASLSACLVTGATAQERIRERTEDLRKIILDGLQAGKNKIVVPPGRYRVTPRDRQHLVFEELDDVTIDATGVEMVCTETTRAITIDGCRNLTIIGLTIDFDPLPYTQGRIVRMSDDKRVHTIELFEGYPAADKVRDFKYEIFRGDTRTLRFGSYHDFKHKKVGPKVIEVTRGGRYRGEEVGDIIAIGTADAPGGSIPHAIYTTGSEGVVLKDVTLYASNCFGFFETNCKGTHYLRCKIDRRSAASDLKKRQDPRIRSLNADAYHSKHAIIGPTIESCTAKFMGDDCTNICGDYHLVMACNGSKLRVVAKRRLNIQPGDPLEVVSYTGARLPDAKAVRVSSPIGRMNAKELEFVSKQRMHAPFKQGKLGQVHEIEIDPAIDLPMGSIIASANRMGNGFKVIGCDFGFNRSRGILIKASHGIVKDNRIEVCWGEAVKVSPEYWWLESGSSNDVAITGNTITNCLGKGIAVYAIAGKGGMAPTGAHNNIVIENNTITDVEDLHIWVSSTKGLTLKDNTYDTTKLKLENCQDVKR